MNGGGLCESPISAVRGFDLRVRGFTQIELLAVIAVIAILLVVIIPAANSLSDTAKEGKCLSNIRTVTQATLSYLADNNGQMPPLAFNHGSYYRAGNTPVGFGVLLKQGYLGDHRVIYCPVRDPREPTLPAISITNFVPLEQTATGGKACSYVMGMFAPGERVLATGKTVAIATEYYFYGTANYAWNHDNKNEFTVGYSDGSVRIVPDPEKHLRSGFVLPGPVGFSNYFTSSYGKNTIAPAGQ